MSHSITSRRRATRRRRRARRTGSPAVRRLARSVRRMSIALAVALSLVAPRAAHRSRQSESGHQPVQLRELVRLERVEALARGALPRRWPARGTASSPRHPRSPARGAVHDTSRCDGGHRSAAERRRDRSPLAVRSRGDGLVRGPTATSVGAPEHAGEDGVEGVPAPGRTRRGTRGPVQAPAGDRPHECERPSEIARRAGVIGTPASCSRRLNAPASAGRSSPSGSTPNGCPERSPRAHRAPRARPRGSRPGPRRT